MTSLRQALPGRLEVEARFQDQRVARRELRTAFYGELFTRVKDEFWRLVASERAERVLELGCGPGDNLAQALGYLAPSVRILLAVDCSLASLREATGGRAIARPHPVQYVGADAERLCVRSETFDLVYGLGILHHISRPSMYGELHRILRPGGRAIFLEPLAGNWLVSLFRTLTPGMRSPFETPLAWSEWEHTATPLIVRHREFLLASVVAAALGLVSGRGWVKRAVDTAFWRLDDRLLTRWPTLNRWCWLSILDFRRPVN